MRESSGEWPSVTYLEWVQERPNSIRYDCAASDLTRETGAGIPAVLQDLPSPPMDISLESLVATQYGPDISASNVLITAGATMANATLMAMMVGQARERTGVRHPTVLTEAGYDPLTATPQALGAEVAFIPRLPERDYGVTPAMVEQMLHDEVCLVVLTNRHNPSGQIVSRETLADIADTLTDYDSTLLVDEVYAPFTPEPKTGTTTAFGGPTAAGCPATVVSNSLTKFFGFNDLRLGWLIGEETVVNQGETIQQHLLDVSPVSRHYARIALHNAEALARRSRELLRENALLLEEFVSKTEGLGGQVDSDHTTAFLNYDGADGDEVAAAALESDVSVVPGRFFGDQARFRVSVSRDPETMAEGLQRLRNVLSSL